ncbi:MAG: hypothetical protein ABI612_20275 [Betaproteobacteria bacterium]
MLNNKIRVPIALHFYDGEIIVADVVFDSTPTPAEVHHAANKVARERGAMKVVVPVEWR